MNSENDSSTNGSELKIGQTHAAYLTSFYTNFEALCFTTIAASYLYDPLFLIVILRWTLLASFVPSTSSALHRIPAVCLVNIGAALIHIFGRSPTPVNEYTRGYVDGGFLVDFVGEFAHTSRFKLVTLDLLILGMMVVMMAGSNQKSSQPRRASQSNDDDTVLQDLDREERGVRLSEENHAAQTDTGVTDQSLLVNAPVQEAAPLLTIDLVDEIRDISRHNGARSTAAQDRNQEILRRLLVAVRARSRTNRNPTTTGTTTASLA